MFHKTIQEFKIAVLWTWGQISVQSIQSLINIIPNSIFQLIENRGNLTNYSLIDIWLSMLFSINILDFSFRVMKQLKIDFWIFFI